MVEKIEDFADTIGEDELLRRYFFLVNFDPERGEWSYNTFQLRDLTPPENYLSVTRVEISPDVIEHAKHSFRPNKLKKLKGYTVLVTSDVRKIDVEKIKLQVLADINSQDGHSGIFTWHDSKLVEGSVEEPEILELKKVLFHLAIPTYEAFPEGVFNEVENLIH